jgi:hypothetical protein
LPAITAKGEAMANEEQLAILEQGVDVWNKWRKEMPRVKIDLSSAQLSRINLSAIDLSAANLSNANLSVTNLGRANLRGTILDRADLTRAYLIEADLTMAKLSSAGLRRTNFSRANLNLARLIGADLSEADLTGANLVAADLALSKFIGTEVSHAKISGSRIYGINVWNLKGEFEEQKNLIITHGLEPLITVDDVRVAQFIYLILNNGKIRDVLNTLTSKSVLILGRFSPPERKEVLDALRDRLREYNLLPIVFDFDRPTDKDFTETIKTLAGLCYFVIADVTNPKSSPLELQATVPDYQIPFVPIIQEGEKPFAMMVDLQKKYSWVLPTRTYSSKEALISKLKEGIIDPAMEKHNELRLIKAQKPDIVSLG